MSLGKIVLDDSLLYAYLKGAKTKKYNKLMRKYIHPHVTNFQQISRVMANIGDLPNERAMLSQMANEPHSHDDLQTLALKTTFKIILTDDISKPFPFVHYENAIVNNRLTFHLAPTQSRSDLTHHLQRLCQNANKVIICDNYFAHNWQHTQSLFLSVLPRKSLLIEYADTMPQTTTTLNSEYITDDYIRQRWHEWSVAQTTYSKYNNCHD